MIFNCLAKRARLSPRGGFTLVELSIVLVILGLLVGGVLTGQSLIRASELRAVTSESQRYVTAVNAFRDKYFALPGDMTNAASFWTTLTAANNGNGDGAINSGAASATAEVFQFWNMLSLAGLIEGKFTGISGAGSGYHSIGGTNVPLSKLAGGNWAVQNIPNFPGDAYAYAFDYGNALLMGAPVAGSVPNAAIIKPEEAWNIDTKMDDGKPGTGKVLVREVVGFAATATSKCTTSASASDYTGLYNLSNTGTACQLYFAKPF